MPRQTILLSALLALSRTTYQAGLSMLVVLMPKCGLCIAAYLHVFSLFGVSLLPFYSWLRPLLFTLLLINLATIWIKGRAVDDYRSFWVSVAGTALLLADKLVWESQAVAIVGAGLLMFATGWHMLRYHQRCKGRFFEG